MKPFIHLTALCLALSLAGNTVHAQNTPPANPTTEKKADEGPFDAREHYTKYEYRIPMRDGAKLFTAVYVPKDASKPYPFLMVRTPYSVSVNDGQDGKSNYGVDHFPPANRRLGPAEDFDRAGYIFVFQDVRGRFESEGKWLEMTPHLDDKKSPADVDPSSDMHDTVDWLLKNVPNNNGRVGIWGISYPGFYTAASIIDSHPAIKAASPQAPMINLFGKGDDAYHNGAFMLAANFSFYVSFGPQKNPTAEPRKWPEFEWTTDDAYEFFLKHGTFHDLEQYFTPGQSWQWDDQVQHDTYDDYWKARDLAPHLKNIHCAVLTVGGLFDAEDLQGPFSAFHAIDEFNPGADNKLVVGPWMHGGWARLDGHHFGYVDFDANTADYYRKYIVFPFFEQHLKDAPDPKLAKATVFETGTNVWRHYPSWPPPGVEKRTLYFQPGGGLGWQVPLDKEFRAGVTGFDTYTSDPNKPVPYLAYYAIEVPPEYMVSDQRFAATRPDVLTYATEPLEEDVTVAGPVSPKLFVSTSGTDSDWDVKLIDVYPPEYPDSDDAAQRANTKAAARAHTDVPPPTLTMAGYEQLIRGEPFRGKFRHGFEKPEPFVPGQVEAVDFTMPDINHTFRRGHRIMVQVQSSWFPLTDRNPQTFVNIPDAKPEDFKPATQNVYRGGAQASGIELPVLAKP